jgi:hypothetical protein
MHFALDMRLDVAPFGACGLSATERQITCDGRRYVESKLPSGYRSVRRADDGQVLGEYRFAYAVRGAIVEDCRRLRAFASREGESK